MAAAALKRAIKQAIKQPIKYNRVTSILEQETLADIDAANAVCAAGAVVALPVTRKVGGNFMQCIGTNGDLADSPDSATASIESSISLLGYVVAEDWTPSATQGIITKWLSPNISYRLAIKTDGQITGGISPDGSASVSIDSTASVGFTDGTGHWVMWVWNDTADTGNFYTSDDPPDTPPSAISWTQLGDADIAQVSAGIYDGTALVEVGTAGNNIPFAGSIFRAQAYSGGSVTGGAFSGGTLALDFNPNDYVGDGATTMLSSTTSELWTIKGDNYVVEPRVPTSSGGVRSGFVGDLPGATTDHFSCADNSLITAGDYDFRIKLSMADWTPAADTSILSRWSSAKLSFLFRSTSASGLQLFISADGSTSTNATTGGVYPSFTNGDTGWIRVTHEFATDETKFYESSDTTDDPDVVTNWVQLSTTKTSITTASTFNSDMPLEIGSRDSGGADNLTGTVTRMAMYDGIDGTRVVDFNPQLYVGGDSIPRPGHQIGDLPGVAGDYFTASDIPAFAVTGNIDLRIRITLDNVAQSEALLMSQGNAGDRAFSWYGSAGKPRFYWSNDGSATQGNTACDITWASLGAANGVPFWTRLTHDVISGDYIYYMSLDDTSNVNEVTWVQMGAAENDVAVRHDSADVLEVGARYLGTAGNLAGVVHRAQMRNGIDGTLVADFNPEDYRSGSAWNSSLTGERWNENGNAAVSGPWDINDQASITGGLPLLLAGEAYANLPGNATDSFTTLDSVANSITDNLDLRVRLSMDDWTPAAAEILLAKYESTGDEKSFNWYVRTTGELDLSISDNGTGAEDSISTVPTGFADGTIHWVRTTFAAGVVNFYVSDDDTNDPDLVSWTPLGAEDVANVHTSIYDGTATVDVGANQTHSASMLAGKVYRAAVYNGIDGVKVVDFNPVDHVYGTTWESYETGELWTIVDQASVASWGLNTVVGTGANVKKHESGSALFFGASGDFINQPMSVANGVTGDIDIRMEVALDDWTSGGNTAFAGIWNANPDKSWIFRITGTGTLGLQTSADGSATLLNVVSTVAVSFVDGAKYWVRVTLDVDNGASGNDVTFYTSIDGITWTQLGAVVTTASATSLHPAPGGLLEVGARSGGTTSRINGSVYAFEIYDGIGGTLVADFNPTQQTLPSDLTVNSSLTAFNGSETEPSTCSCPDSAANTIGGNLRMEVKLALPDWTPASRSYVMAKYTDVSGRKSYWLSIEATGKIQLLWSEDGTAVLDEDSTVATGFTDGTAHWIRGDLVVDNGNGQHTITFYTSDDETNDPALVEWTQLGTVITNSDTTNVKDPSSTVDLNIGSRQSGGISAVGTYFAGALYDNDVLVQEFRPERDFVTGATLTSSSTGEVWTATAPGTFTGQWTLAGNVFIQNSGQPAIHTIGSVGFESTIQQTIPVPFVASVVLRFSDPAPGADQNVLDSRDAGDRLQVFSKQLDSDKFAMYEGTASIVLSEAYNTNSNTWTMQVNGDASTALTVSGTGEVEGDAGAEPWDYGTLLAKHDGTQTMLGNFQRLLLQTGTLKPTERDNLEANLVNRYNQ